MGLRTFLDSGIDWFSRALKRKQESPKKQLDFQSYRPQTLESMLSPVLKSEATDLTVISPQKHFNSLAKLELEFHRRIQPWSSSNWKSQNWGEGCSSPNLTFVAKLNELHPADVVFQNQVLDGMESVIVEGCKKTIRCVDCCIRYGELLWTIELKKEPEAKPLIEGWINNTDDARKFDSIGQLQVFIREVLKSYVSDPPNFHVNTCSLRCHAYLKHAVLPDRIVQILQNLGTVRINGIEHLIRGTTPVVARPASRISPLDFHEVIFGVRFEPIKKEPISTDRHFKDRDELCYAWCELMKGSVQCGFSVQSANCYRFTAKFKESTTTSRFKEAEDKYKTININGKKHSISTIAWDCDIYTHEIIWVIGLDPVPFVPKPVPVDRHFNSVEELSVAWHDVMVPYSLSTFSTNLSNIWEIEFRASLRISSINGLRCLVDGFKTVIGIDGIKKVIVTDNWVEDFYGSREVIWTISLRPITSDPQPVDRYFNSVEELQLAWHSLVGPNYHCSSVSAMDNEGRLTCKVQFRDKVPEDLQAKAFAFKTVKDGFVCAITTEFWSEDPIRKQVEWKLKLNPIGATS